MERAQIEKLKRVFASQLDQIFSKLSAADSANRAEETGAAWDAVAAALVALKSVTGGPTGCCKIPDTDSGRVHCVAVDSEPDCTLAPPGGLGGSEFTPGPCPDPCP
jgi:hypothetical protein